ncbi:SDR family NAD(P)-dependent oxidoreductase [Sphingobacterium sp. SG20118]|uniref:SDR family NAD(P)-dependent oxidoreductase n=1 Tax=Sphingobacterium sp. SG20118 TaxID=3367156 RepID=UPI0037DFC801
MKVSEQRVKTDRYALVTGASDRIGKAIALELAEMGYHLVLHYRSSLAKIEQVKQQIEGIGRKAVSRTIRFFSR